MAPGESTQIDIELGVALLEVGAVSADISYNADELEVGELNLAQGVNGRVVADGQVRLVATDPGGFAPGSVLATLDVTVERPDAASPSVLQPRFEVLGSTIEMDPLEAVRGDVDCSGTTDIADALLISQYVVGNRTAVSGCERDGDVAQLNIDVGDVNGDTRVDIVDALLISRCEVGVVNVACADYSIRGTVTAGADRISGLQVCAESSLPAARHCVNTSATGTYHIGLERASNVIVSAVDPSGRYGYHESATPIGVSGHLTGQDISLSLSQLAAPVIVSAERSGDIAEFEWEAVAGADEYHWALALPHGLPQFGTTTANSLKIPLSVGEGDYCLALRWSQSLRRSDFADTACVLALPASTGVEIVTAPPTDAPTSSSMVVSWVPTELPPRTDDVEVLVDGVVHTVLKADETPYTVAGLRPGTEYSFAIRARLGYEANPAVVERTATTTFGLEDPGSFDLVGRVARETYDSREYRYHLDLSWTAAKDDHGISHYDVYIDGEHRAKRSNSMRADRLLYIDPGRQYDVRVVAVDHDGNSFSRTLSALVPTATLVSDSTPPTWVSGIAGMTSLHHDHQLGRFHFDFQGISDYNDDDHFLPVAKFHLHHDGKVRTISRSEFVNSPDDPRSGGHAVWVEFEGTNDHEIGVVAEDEAGNLSTMLTATMKYLGPPGRVSSYEVGAPVVTQPAVPFRPSELGPYPAAAELVRVRGDWQPLGRDFERLVDVNPRAATLQPGGWSCHQTDGFYVAHGGSNGELVTKVVVKYSPQFATSLSGTVFTLSGESYRKASTATTTGNYLSFKGLKPHSQHRVEIEAFGRGSSLGACVVAFSTGSAPSYRGSMSVQSPLPGRINVNTDITSPDSHTPPFFVYVWIDENGDRIPNDSEPSDLSFGRGRAVHAGERLFSSVFSDVAPGRRTVCAEAHPVDNPLVGSFLVGCKDVDVSAPPPSDQRNPCGYDDTYLGLPFDDWPQARWQVQGMARNLGMLGSVHGHQYNIPEFTGSCHDVSIPWSAVTLACRDYLESVAAHLDRAAESGYMGNDVLVAVETYYLGLFACEILAEPYGVVGSKTVWEVQNSSLCMLKTDDAICEVLHGVLESITSGVAAPLPPLYAVLPR